MAKSTVLYKVMKIFHIFEKLDVRLFKGRLLEQEVSEIVSVVPQTHVPSPEELVSSSGIQNLPWEIVIELGTQRSSFAFLPLESFRKFRILSSLLRIDHLFF